MGGSVGVREQRTDVHFYERERKCEMNVTERLGV